MDMKIKAEVITATANPVWDVQVTKGIVPILSGDQEELQVATLAGFLQKATIPQLPDAGVPWQNFLTHKISFGELDSYIRDSLTKAGKTSYYPQYELEGTNLTMTIGKVDTEVTA